MKDYYYRILLVRKINDLQQETPGLHVITRTNNKTGEKTYYTEVDMDGVELYANNSEEHKFRNFIGDMLDVKLFIDWYTMGTFVFKKIHMPVSKYLSTLLTPLIDKEDVMVLIAPSDYSSINYFEANW